MDSLYVSDLLYCRALLGCDTIGNAVYGTSYVGMWRSLVARFVRDEEVAGSNPVIPTRNSNERANCSLVLFMRDDMREAGAGCTPPPPNMNRLKGLYERCMCFLVQFLRVSLG